MYLLRSDPTRCDADRESHSSGRNGQFVTLVVTNQVILLEGSSKRPCLRFSWLLSTREWNWRLLSPWTTSPGEVCNKRWVISPLYNDPNCIPSWLMVARPAEPSLLACTLCLQSALYYARKNEKEIENPKARCWLPWPNYWMANT
jgi:hypothetical protein